MTDRIDGRRADQLRPVQFTRNVLPHPPGSVEVAFGQTRLLCTASIDDGVPPFLKGSGSGWLTAEYGMLPGSTSTRKSRKTGGREKEIQRLIGRALRAAVDLSALGPRTIYLDCDVLSADGGTRTAAISGAWVALADGLATLVERGQLPSVESVLVQQIAAISVGRVDSCGLLDLCYHEDAGAEVDLNVVMTAGGEYIEIQGTAEGKPFGQPALDQLLGLARSGIAELVALQTAALDRP